MINECKRVYANTYNTHLCAAARACCCCCAERKELISSRSGKRTYVSIFEPLPLPPPVAVAKKKVRTDHISITIRPHTHVSAWKLKGAQSGKCECTYTHFLHNACNSTYAAACAGARASATIAGVLKAFHVKTQRKRQLLKRKLLGHLLWKTDKRSQQLLITSVRGICVHARFNV